MLYLERNSHAKPDNYLIKTVSVSSEICLARSVIDAFETIWATAELDPGCGDLLLHRPDAGVTLWPGRSA